MAKENSLPPIFLFIASGLLLAGGWLMSTFPIFIFLGLAPLFALTDRAVADTSSVWEKMEWVLFSLAVSFLAARVFDFSFIVSSTAYAILFTLPFIGHIWVRQKLGPRAGKITIVLLWLTAEYLLLKIIPNDSIFLADALRLKSSWTGWNIHTGYLGTTGWILLGNLVVYQAYLSQRPFWWPWILASVIIIVGPLLYSYFSGFTPITRETMVNLYSGKSIISDVTYLARGEFVVRTATWLSTLILLFTFVKSQTAKR